MKNTKYLITTILLGVVFLPQSSLLANAVKKNCYLSFHAPPRLHFHEVPVSADRTNLLTLGAPVSQSLEVLNAENNTTNDITEFPLTSYDDANSELGIEIEAERIDSLPPSDPFVDYDAQTADLDSTDELLKLFENMEKSGRSASGVVVNFIPPYSSDGGNFKIESKSSYKRRLR
jgi:hypothetical protein